jgi:hypothetical protein
MDRIKRLRRWWLHRKWQRRFNLAWRTAVRKSKGYHELIDACSPWYYFKNELDGLKGVYFDEKLNRYVKYDGY